MRKKIRFLASVSGAALALAATIAFAGDASDYELSGGVGVIGIEAKEYVFNGSGSGDTLSLLVWQSIAPVLTAGFAVSWPDGWTFDADMQVALSGDSYMEDFDWLAPFRIDFAPGNWTDRSQHDNTNLNWFFDGRLTVGKNIYLDTGTTANLHGGFKYTDVQWTATGGSYLYSTGGSRDDAGTFGANTDVIIYRQKLPAIFAGADTEMVQGDWTFNVGAHAGVTFMGEAVDQHLIRTPPLRFIDKLNPAPLAGAEAQVSFNTGNGSAFFVKGAMEKVFLGRGDTETYNNNTNAPISASTDAAGAELISGSVSAGFSGQF